MNNRIMLATLAFLLTLGLCVGGTCVWAYGDGTPDTDPPAEESLCDGLSGRVWGLCVAYCEAQDCPVSEHPSCNKLRDKLYNLLANDVFPCDPLGPGLE